MWEKVKHYKKESQVERAKHYQKERQVCKVVWLEPRVTESFDKSKRVVNFFKSSTIGRNDLGTVQEDL